MFIDEMPQLKNPIHDLRGEVLRPGQDGYRRAAATLFAEGTPDVIVRPRNPRDVATALHSAAHLGLTVSIRSGGHSLLGFGTHTDGMVIDLALLNHVEVVDADTRLVRIGAGANWGTVARALDRYGLGLSAGDTNDVGVGGLTLGGGIGWLVRRYGLAIDSLVGADVVTAEGRLVHASADQHPELFWALRGGGGNFGVVVEFQFVAQPVGAVHFGVIGYRLDDPARLLTGWRDLMRASEDALTTTLVLMPPMMGRPAAAMLLCCYAGSDGAAAARSLAPFRELGTVTVDRVNPMRYADILEDADHPAGLRLEVRNTLVPELHDDVVAAVAAEAAAQRTVLTLRSLGGAMARVPADATAFAHRDAEAMLVAALPLPADATGEQVEEALARWAPLAAHGRGAYVNFLGSASPADVAAAYPPATYRRLAAVKRAYDPGNVFRRNHNVPPDDVRTVA